MTKKQKIGVVLGSGSARGWAHIGVLNALNEAGIHPDVVCGSSAGAIIAAAYANNKLSDLESGVKQLTRWNLIRFFEINFSGGVIDSSRLRSFLKQYVTGEHMAIEQLSIPFACNATDLKLGREVSFSNGSLLDAIWCSIALPGLIPPVSYQDRWLVDGGLVNPVPISLARNLGADRVIAVNLNGDLLASERPIAISMEENKARTSSAIDGWLDSAAEILKKSASFIFTEDANAPPSLFETMAGSINIMQDLITRSKMAGDPPDIVLTPRLGQLGLLEFDRAEEAIDEGRQCVERVLPEIKYILGH